MRALAQFLVAGVTIGSIYSLVALGLILLVNTADTVNVAHGEFLILGAVVTISGTQAGIPLVFASLLAILATVAVAASAGVLVLIPMIKRGSAALDLVMVTIGISIVLAQAVGVIWGRGALYLKPFSGDNPVVVGGVAIQPQTFWVLGVSLTVMLLLYMLFKSTRLGLAMQACLFNRTQAALSGVNVMRITFYALCLSAALGAIAGILITPITAVNFSQGLVTILKGFTAAVIGGFGKVTGAVIGGLVLGIIEALGAGYISGRYQEAIPFAVLLLMLAFRPRGILGTRLIL